MTDFGAHRIHVISSSVDLWSRYATFNAAPALTIIVVCLAMQYTVTSMSSSDPSGVDSNIENFFDDVPIHTPKPKRNGLLEKATSYLDDLKDLVSTDGRSSLPPAPLSSHSLTSGTEPSTSPAMEDRRRGSLMAQVVAGLGAEQTLDCNMDTKSGVSRSSRLSQGSRSQDVSKRLQKVKQKREARRSVSRDRDSSKHGNKEKQAPKNKEIKTLMEQVASIAAQSRGILRAQPKQNEQQKLMGELIGQMGKMVDTMSRLMLVAENNAEDDNGDDGETATMSSVDLDSKTEQIITLLSDGTNDPELERKREEIFAILSAPATKRKQAGLRTKQRQLALEELEKAQETKPPRRSKSAHRRPSSKATSKGHKERSKSMGSKQSSKRREALLAQSQSLLSKSQKSWTSVGDHSDLSTSAGHEGPL